MKFSIFRNLRSVFSGSVGLDLLRCVNIWLSVVSMISNSVSFLDV